MANPYTAITGQELVPGNPTLAGVVQTSGVQFAITPWITQQERPTTWTAAVTETDPDGVTRQGIFIGTATANALTAGTYQLWTKVTTGSGETPAWPLGEFAVI